MVLDFSDPLSSLAMAAASPNTLPNPHDPNQPFVTLSTTNVIKLHFQNYLDWKLQIKAILNCQNLIGYVDGTFSQPTAIVSVINVAQPNPEFSSWFRQD